MVLAHLEPELELLDDIGDDCDDVLYHHYLSNSKKMKKMPHFDHFSVVGKLTHMLLGHLWNRFYGVMGLRSKMSDWMDGYPLDCYNY